MSLPRTFLLADDGAHATVLDHWIMEHLRDSEGAQGAQWSGIFTDGVRYGVLWDAPASGLFGTPEEDPAVVLATEDADSPWERHEEPAEEAPQ